MTKTKHTAVLAVLAVIGVLAERWPAAFVVLEARRRPLKIGIATDTEATLAHYCAAEEMTAA